MNVGAYVLESLGMHGRLGNEREEQSLMGSTRGSEIRMQGGEKEDARKLV